MSDKTIRLEGDAVNWREKVLQKLRSIWQAPIRVRMAVNAGIDPAIFSDLFRKAGSMLRFERPYDTAPTDAERVLWRYVKQNMAVTREALASGSVLRVQFHRMLIDQEFDFFVTANFNQVGLTFLSAERRLRRFQAYLDRKLFGKYWAKRQPSERTSMVAVPEEDENGNLHFHILLRLPSNKYDAKFRRSAHAQFKAVAPRGQLYIEQIASPFAHGGIVNYILKTAHEAGKLDKIVFV